MSIRAAGGTTVSTTFVPANKNALVDSVETHLASAGWTTVSGAGTGTIVMETAAHPVTGAKTRLNIDDTTDTNCAFFQLTDESGGIIPAANCNLFPDAGLRTYRIVANQFQFFIFEESPALNNNRSTVLFSMPWIPAHENVPAGSLRAILACDSQSDADVTTRNSWRAASLNWDDGRGQAITSGSPAVYTNGGDNGINIVYLSCHDDRARLRWMESDEYPVYEALIAWEGAVLGQLWDCYCTNKSVASSATDNFGGVAYRCVGPNNSQVLSLWCRDA